MFLHSRFSRSHRGRAAETIPGFGSLSVNPNSPFPSGRIRRLDDCVLDTIVFHDQHLAVLLVGKSTLANSSGQTNLNVSNELRPI
jgi:hypothetical protein